MEKLSEKFQEELWSKIRPLLEWHRFILFVILNFLFCFNFFSLFVDALQNKTLHDIPNIFLEMSNELKIRDFLFSALIAFYLSPWLSSKVNWILLHKIQFGLSTPLQKSLKDFAEAIASTNLKIPSDLVDSKLKKEKEAIKQFRLLKTLCEIWIVVIPIGYFQLLDSNYRNIILSIILIGIGFYGISLLMMIIFLRDIVPAEIIRQFKKFRNDNSSQPM
jgi:ABC-type multidrug transport system fused ATPase/permease subunit